MDIDRVPFCGSTIQKRFSVLREGRVLGKVPRDRVRIDDGSRHQMSSRGKFFHISRWFSSNSSAVSVMFKSAHRPLPLHRGFKSVDSLRSFSACVKSSCCFSGGRERTVSKDGFFEGHPMPLPIVFRYQESERGPVCLIVSSKLRGSGRLGLRLPASRASHQGLLPRRGCGGPRSSARRAWRRRGRQRGCG